MLVLNEIWLGTLDSGEWSLPFGLHVFLWGVSKLICLAKGVMWKMFESSDDFFEHGLGSFGAAHTEKRGALGAAYTILKMGSFGLTHTEKKGSGLRLFWAHSRTGIIWECPPWDLYLCSYEPCFSLWQDNIETVFSVSKNSKNLDIRKKGNNYHTI